MLVPLSSKYPFAPFPATWRSGYVGDRDDPAASSDTIRLPGATRSGFSRWSNRVGPRELYVATVSSDRSTVPCVFSAPTVIAYGELPGDSMPATTVVPSGELPEVARRRHHHDARPPRPARPPRTADRRQNRFEHRMAQRQVDDADAVPRPVLDRPVDGLDDVARQARSVGAQHAQVDQVRAGRHARSSARSPAGPPDRPRHDARHVRAVPVLVDARAPRRP